jgi:hypothetical protein
MKKALCICLPSLLAQAFARTGKPVHLIGVDVRFAEAAAVESVMERNRIVRRRLLLAQR